MAVAYDAFSAASGTTTFSWTHTPVGTPRGVTVFIVQDISGVDQITGVTYGGVAMTEIALSPLLKTGGEPAVTYGYHLGSAIPTGAQTVAVTVSGGTDAKRAVCVSVTAAGDTEVQDTTTIQSNALTDPSGTLSLGAVSCFCWEAFYSGLGSAGGITPLTGWTSRDEHDFGVDMAGFYTYDTVGTADVTIGYTASSDDCNLIGVAIKETVPAGHPATKRMGGVEFAHRIGKGVW